MVPQIQIFSQSYYVLCAGWTGSTGFVTKDILQAHLPPPGPDTIILRCGPLLMNVAVGKALDELGYSAEQQFQF